MTIKRSSYKREAASGALLSGLNYLTNLSNLPPIRQKAAQEFVNFTAQFTPPYYGMSFGPVSLLGAFVKFGMQDETAKPS